MQIPFDASRLDRLMDEAGLDVLLATSKHNVQYLLGGHRSIFFDYMDAIGVSRYLPIVVYPKGKPDKAAYFGHRLEGFQKEVKPFWTPEAQTNSSGALDTMKKATDYLRSSGVPNKRIGIETTFMPMDAGASLRKAMPAAEIKDALVVLERLRLRKSPEELAMRVARAADGIINGKILRSKTNLTCRYIPGRRTFSGLGTSTSVLSVRVLGSRALAVRVTVAATGVDSAPRTVIWAGNPGLRLPAKTCGTLTKTRSVSICATSNSPVGVPLTVTIAWLLKTGLWASVAVTCAVLVIGVFIVKPPATAVAGSGASPSAYRRPRTWS